MYKTEADFQTKVMNMLRSMPDLKAFKASNRYNKGVSDVIICYKGKYVAIELKNGDGQPTKLQTDFISEIEAAGGIGGVAWTLQDVKDILAKVKD